MGSSQHWCQHCDVTSECEKRKHLPFIYDQITIKLGHLTSELWQCVYSTLADTGQYSVLSAGYCSTNH